MQLRDFGTLQVAGEVGESGAVARAEVGELGPPFRVLWR